MRTTSAYHVDLRRCMRGYVCRDCGESGRHYRVGKPRIRCHSCTKKYRSVMAVASVMVMRAVKAGKLKPVRGQKCTDCGKPARAYDHRDYRKPLVVEPVCASCNALRGPGKWDAI